MFYNKSMDALSRLQLLSTFVGLEAAEERSPVTPGSLRPQAANCREGLFVYPAQLPNGRQIKLLKTLLSSACERDCYYCPFRAGRDFRRATFRPEEFARLFMQLHLGGMAEGLFLSSGIAGGSLRTQDKLIETAEILRFKLGFRGYIHLKIMPGAERAQVERCMQLADRVSVNLEAPSPKRLQALAPHKVFFDELLAPLRWVDEIRTNQPPALAWNRRWPSSATQFVAGGSGESDLELLSTTEYLSRQLHLRRVYFSAFRPIPDTPLENRPPVPALREQRLYQASFLLRDYGFNLEELPFGTDGNLPLHTDPKTAWAQANLTERPLEINHASREELLRLPGIGPKSAEVILRARHQGCLRGLDDLRKLGIQGQRSAAYILLDGRRPPLQGSFW